MTDLAPEPAPQAWLDPARADSLVRAALGALLQWQLQTPTDTLPMLDEALLRQQLAPFAPAAQHAAGCNWTDAQQQAWSRVVERLLASALAQPRLAVHGDWLRQHGRGPRAPQDGHDQPSAQPFNGPLTWDLAAVLRGTDIACDEAQELDAAVRWWQQARAAGLPLGEVFGADFGELWRALEWTGLHQHLMQIGRLAQQPPTQPADGAPPERPELQHLAAQASRVALRYAPLKPLLTLLQPLSGQGAQAGFTF